MNCADGFYGSTSIDENTQKMNQFQFQILFMLNVVDFRNIIDINVFIYSRLCNSKVDFRET